MESFYDVQQSLSRPKYICEKKISVTASTKDKTIAHGRLHYMTTCLVEINVSVP